MKKSRIETINETISEEILNYTDSDLGLEIEVYSKDGLNLRYLFPKDKEDSYTISFNDRLQSEYIGESVKIKIKR